jgi:hypothetical protein
VNEVASLRASNAALKAENKTLKTRCEMVYCAYCSFEARCPTDNKALTDHVKVCEFHPVRKLEAELKRYTSWTPQDPGTKEAMEYFAEKPDCRKYETLNRNIETVLNSYRVAMVRLEEAEKGREKAEAFKTWTHAYLDNKGVPITVEDEHLAAGCRIGGRMDWVFASLASVTKERDEAAGAWSRAQDQVLKLTNASIRKSDDVLALEASLAELRKRMGEIADRVNNEGDDSQSCVSDIGHMARSALASPPSPAPGKDTWDPTRGSTGCDGTWSAKQAPVESKPKEGA